MRSSDRYDNYFLKKKMQSEGVEDLSGPMQDGVAKTDWLGNSNLTQNDNVVSSNEASVGKTPDSKSAATAGAQALAQGGNAMDAGSAALMASGNPYAIGAGLGLTTISTINKNRQQQDQNRYLAEVQRVKARQDAIDRLAQIGQNLKA